MKQPRFRARDADALNGDVDEDGDVKKVRRS
jgi:hypothetical protein